MKKGIGVFGFLLICLTTVSCSLPIFNVEKTKEFHAKNFYYEQLSFDEQLLYKALLSEEARKENKVEISFSHEMAKEEVVSLIQNAFDAVSRDYPELLTICYEEDGMTYVLDEETNILEIEHIFLDDYESYVEKMENIEKAVTEIGDLYGTPSEISRQIASYLKEYVDYSTEDEECNTMYGALVKGKANCYGIAKAYAYLCERYGVEAIVVSGTNNISKTSYHAWNYVWLEDGYFYAVDVTNACITGKECAFYSANTPVTDTEKYNQKYEALGDISQRGEKVFTYPKLSKKEFEPVVNG